MNAAKVAISLDPKLLQGLDRLVKACLFRTRSQAIQAAVREKLARLDKSRLARECLKLSPGEERASAEFGLATDAKEWPAY